MPIEMPCSISQPLSADGNVHLLAAAVMHLDIPAGTHGLSEMLHELDLVVLDAGGRHYMAKDSHTTPEAIRQGYPRLAEWQAIRNSVDPDGVWQSDLGRRLGLID